MSEKSAHNYENFWEGHNRFHQSMLDQGGLSPELEEYHSAKAEETRVLAEKETENDLFRRLGFSAVKITGGVLSANGEDSHLVGETKSKEELVVDIKTAREKLDDMHLQGKIDSDEYRYLSGALGGVLPKYLDKQ